MDPEIEGDSCHTADSSTVASTNQLSITIPLTQPTYRLSMDDFYRHLITQSEPSTSPPPYDAVQHAPSLRRKFNVQPREDEGRETLPAYSTAISLENVFMRKMELEGAVDQALDRNWYRVMVSLQGTALTLHKCKSTNLFGSAISGGKHHADLPAGNVRGAFLRSYNLQHADVGIAADYIKRRYVIRVRAETDQFLLSCHKIETFVLWLQSLFAAIDLAPPLDEREIPQDLSIPREPRRRPRLRPSASTPDAARNERLMQEQEDIIRNHFPNLSAGEGGSADEGEGEGEEDDDIDEVLPTRLSNSAPPSRIRTPFASASPSSILASSSSSAPSRSFSGPISASNSISLTIARRQSGLTAPRQNPSISPDGKWAPQHHWTHLYDMLYAKRCMAVLTHTSPRKTNLVIVKGKQWVVDWATGKMVDWSIGRSDCGDGTISGSASMIGNELLEPPGYMESLVDTERPMTA